jgi:hypothetical protein
VVALTQSFAARPNPIANRTMAFPAMKPMRIVDMSCMVTNVCADGMSGVEKAPALHSDSGRRAAPLSTGRNWRLGTTAPCRRYGIKAS